MNSKNWQQVKALLDEVLHISPSDRDHFLKTKGINGSILAEVTSLLAFEENSRDFMSLDLGEYSKDFVAEEIDEGTPIDRKIGIYTITGELGIGGMGAVYVAERHDGKFAQAVAIKLLRREINTSSIRKNFEREKNILAALSHPNIAGLLDTGETEDGVPYLVMEYVDGVPIDRFCEENKLDLASRLKLFNKVCDAVAFAHRNLIVHRDLKPSNVLVTADGVPKLLDFGISKILNVDTAEGSSTLSAMTPEYASPEQINDGKITTATDIYSLGIVLYKIVTGEHPFKRNGQTGSDLVRAITEEEPRKPSEHSSYRGSLRGDVDNIILKALSKEPERRYRSVDQFSDDIWRFIDGKPVEARSATLGYRVSKFYRRNKVAVTAAILIVVTLAAGIAVSAWQARVARANAAVALIESENAKAEQRKAERVSEFMLKVVRYANPNWYAEGYKLGGEARVIDALNDMSSKIETAFADQPDVLAELHHQLGDVYNSRRESGSKEKARAHFERAYELRRSHYGDWHELVAKDMVYLYWTRPNPSATTEAEVKLLSDAIVMMRATGPKNLNLPYMLDTFVDRLSRDDHELAGLQEMFLRHVPQPAPNDKLRAADQLFDEMLVLLQGHFGAESGQVLFQKCARMNLKWQVNKRSEAEEFYESCMRYQNAEAAIGKTFDATILKRIAEYRMLSGRE